MRKVGGKGGEEIGEEMREGVGERVETEIGGEVRQEMGEEMEEEKLTQFGCKKTCALVSGLVHCICWYSSVGFCIPPGNGRWAAAALSGILTTRCDQRMPKALTLPLCMIVVKFVSTNFGTGW